MNNVLLLMALLGMVLNIGKKMNAQQNLAKAGNAKFSILCYLKDDWYSLLSALVAVVIAVYNIQEIQKVIPEKYSGLLKLLFVFIGYTGSDLIIYLFSKSRNAVLRKIDIKTNIADGIDPPKPTPNEAG